MITAAVYVMAAIVLQLTLRKLVGLRGLRIATTLACIPPAMIWVHGARLALFDQSVRDIERGWIWNTANAFAVALAILLWSHGRLRRSIDKG